MELTVNAPDTLPEIDVDSQRMAQVLGNLVANALRHTPSGGRVTLSAAETDDGVELSVEDTGKGIPEEDLPMIFSRFYRVDQARARQRRERSGVVHRQVDCGSAWRQNQR